MDIRPLKEEKYRVCITIGGDTQCPDKDIWVKALANDFGRLAQGIKDRMPTGNIKIFFIHPIEIPAHKKVTYGRLVVDIRPLKEEKYRVRITFGGDNFSYFKGLMSTTRRP